MKTEVIGEVVAVKNNRIHIECISSNGDVETHVLIGNSVSIGDIVEVEFTNNIATLNVIGKNNGHK